MMAVLKRDKCHGCMKRSGCTKDAMGVLLCQGYEAKPARPIDKGPMSHHDLCHRAERWLLNTCKCAFVLRELSTIAMEIPDAIGWKGANSFLIECKVSRSDFLADRKKYYRRKPEMGMGGYRYMMCPNGLVNPDELPDGWGLLYCLPKSVKLIVKPAEQPEWNNQNEMIMMVSALRRVHLRGDLEKIYRFEELKEVA